MPIFVVPLFMGLAAVSGAAGVGMAAKGGLDQSKANKLNTNSSERIRWAANRLEQMREQCSESLNALGKEKLFILDGSMQRFLHSFEQLKNVDFTASEGLDELERLRIDKASFDELKTMSGIASSLMEGGITGVASGALAAFGAYSAASTFAVASTGTAISALSGAAATNATLAFFGGGSLAAGGMGMAGGAAVLGGLVAGPALLVMGIIVGAKGGKNLEEAKTQSAEVSKYCEEMLAGIDQCIAIRRNSSMFHALLARLDARFLPLVFKMERIISEEGTDYSAFTQENKRTIAAAASTAASIKAVLDTPLLAEDGSLTAESVSLVQSDLGQ
ncbi:hypothetical protein [Bifidobacterium leontopitheci]|uniref:Chemotaxis protein n=1 Tax=Bifidobacterium leontopitheci TaxID=2650774 RepID=A0A6I1GI79_9BIFI|nr:hypothetical protein [Bifidobacterium leontopitheci]KAB7791305.1 hypothetical protein F7D09_0258 [Bifidobacterium leontopitheci]